MNHPVHFEQDCTTFTKTVCSLGVLLNSQPSLDNHVATVARNALTQLKLLCQLKPYLSCSNHVSVLCPHFNTMFTVSVTWASLVNHVSVTSKLDYYTVQYVGLPAKTIQNLQLAQNAAA